MRCFREAERHERLLLQVVRARVLDQLATPPLEAIPVEGVAAEAEHPGVYEIGHDASGEFR